MLQAIFTDVSAASYVGCIAVMLLAGFLLSRLTKLLKLPNVTGYLLAGILLGPYALNLASAELLSGFDLVTDVALAFIAFGVGKYFKLSTFKTNGAKVLALTLCESLAAAAAVILVMKFAFGLSTSFSLLLGAIGCATAPASTMMTIRQYHAKGRFVDTLISVIAVDDAVAILAFNICVLIAGSGGSVSALDVILPIAYNLAMVAAGIGLGLLLKALIRDRFSKDSRLIMTLTAILGLTAVCGMLGISPLLSCMALGAAYVNANGDKEMFKVMNRFSPPVLLLFFVYSGMNLNLTMLASAGLVGVVYFFTRIAGKYAGATLGGLATRAEPEIRKYFGLALIPQAGVSIGLAAMAARILPPDQGALLSAIILSSAVLYELVGPLCAKIALFRARAVPPRDTGALAPPPLAAGKPAKQSISQL